MTAPIRAWKYAAEDENGVIAEGLVDAVSRDDAIVAIQRDKLRPVFIEPAPKRLLPRLFRRSAPARLRSAELALIARRLGDLLGAGLPLAHALRLAFEQARRDRERDYFHGLLKSVRSGATLTDAVKQSTLQSSRLFEALVAAGEALGALSAQFSVLANHYEDAVKLRREIVGELIYPAALTILVLLTLIFMSFFVLPQFETIFLAADATPPPETVFVLAAAGALRTYWIFGAAFAAAIFLFLQRTASRRPEAIEKAILALPPAREFARLREAGAYFRTLASLLEGRTPLARALPLASATVSFSVIRTSLNQVERRVRNGERLGAALKVERHIPQELVSFIELGEETGTLATMAGQAASTAEDRLREKVKALTALLAPVLTALMGLLTAGVIAAVMSGVLSLNDAIY